MPSFGAVNEAYSTEKTFEPIDDKGKINYELEERKHTISQSGKCKEVKERDPFDAVEDFKPAGVPWRELDTTGKVKRVSVVLAKVILLLGLLYLFICSLSFLTSAFRLLGGKKAGETFSSNNVISNPFAGLMMGVLGTVLLQSSSTTTSIVVAMVASGIIAVKPAIPIVMGANIGTSVTNTIVSLCQMGEKEEFRRAFAGATVHDMFNLLAVLVLLPLELASQYLFRLTDAIVKSLDLETDKALKKDLLKKITKPFTNVIIQLDKKIIEKIAKGDKSVGDKTLIKFWCDKGTKVNKIINGTITNETDTVFTEPCKFLFHDTGMTDPAVGVILLMVSLIILCVCLVLIVKTLHSLLRGQIAIIIRKTFNSDFPKPFTFLTGYLAILVGAGLTILVQSSSIFTSAITPLVGLGIVGLERVYPLTLGANIGTTATGILAAFAANTEKLDDTLQIALCHLFFNISGIIVWYPIPHLRRIPIKLAKLLGNTTAEYRWFAVAYLFVVFFIIPGVIFALSLAGWRVFTGIMVPVAVLFLVVIIISILQHKKKKWLPRHLQTWEWLPKPLRSLEPYDRAAVGLGRKMNIKKLQLGKK